MNYENFIIKYRWWLIILPIIITILAAIPLLNTRINPDLEKYLPADTPAMISKTKIDSIFGNSDPVILIFETDDVLNANTLNRIKALSRSFNRAKEFSSVISLYDTKNIKSEYGAMVVDPVIKQIPKNDQQRDQLREEIRHNQLAYKLVVSEDFTKTAIILKIAESITDDQIIEIIDETLKKFPGDENIYKGGTPYLRVSINSDISKDMLTLMPIGLLIMIVFLFISFREYRGVILPFLAVIMSIIISLGFFTIMGWELSIITILSPIMMIAIANDYSIHFIARYQELNAQHPNWTMKQITINTLSHLKTPVTLTGITTIAGILGLTVHILLPAQQLGIATSLGIAFAIILNLTFIPAIMASLKKAKPLKSLLGEKESLIDKILLRFAKVSTGKPIIVIFIFGSFFLLAGAGIVFLNVDSNSESLLPEKHPFSKATAITNNDFGGTKYVTVLFEGDIKDPGLLNRMDDYEAELEANPLIGSVTSIATMIKIMSRSINDEGDSLYNMIPDSRNAIAQYLELYSMSGDPGDFENLVNFDYSRALMLVQFRADSKYALDNILKEIDILTANDPNRSIIGGYCLVDKELAEAVIRGQYNSLIFAIIIIAILLIIIFRSFSSGIIGTLPLIYTITVLFGIMGWFGIKLDIATAMLSSIAIGIGVDYTIHFFWRYKLELALGKQYNEAITTTLRTTGRGIAINAFSVIIGFLVLFVSAFLMIKYFALLIILSVLLCLLCALILIPSLCLLIKPKFLEPNNLKK